MTASLNKINDTNRLIVHGTKYQINYGIYSSTQDMSLSHYTGVVAKQLLYRISYLHLMKFFSNDKRPESVCDYFLACIHFFIPYNIYLQFSYINDLSP
jgi:hypothetical protein